MADDVIVVVLIVAFALALTTHLWIVFALTLTKPRVRALAALVLPPLAPYWAWTQGMKRRAVLWVIFVVVYGVALTAAGAFARS